LGAYVFTTSPVLNGVVSTSSRCMGSMPSIKR
jgi:hypothetical protein